MFGLLGECFPGLPGGAATAEALGFPWADQTTPFTLSEQGRTVAHVGVLAHPMRLDGRAAVVAGVHAVGTTEAWRRRGLARRLLGEALDWVDERFALAKLHTDLPEVYAPHGFRVVPTHRFRTPPQPPAQVQKRLLQPLRHAADADLLRSLLRLRTPASNRCATADPGWLELTVAALSGALSSGFWHIESHNAIVALGEEAGGALILDVIAPEPPPLAVVMGAAGAADRPVLWSFSPELSCDRAEAIPTPPEAGVLMVRGDWPLGEPFGISPLWEH